MRARAGSDGEDANTLGMVTKAAVLGAKTPAAVTTDQESSEPSLLGNARTLSA